MAGALPSLRGAQRRGNPHLLRTRTEIARRLLRNAAVLPASSFLLYVLAFGFILDRPLALGFLRQQIDAKLARAAAIDGPKLVILAGSNGPYSHRCEVIEPILGMPCVNGGVAVGIGLDYLFARWQRVLHRGDIVYLPMEEAQYVRTRAATEVGPDAAIMFRHDWRTLASLGAERWLAALFSFDLRAALMGPIEAALLLAHFHDPRAEVTGATNAWGDHVGHTAELAATSRAVLATAIADPSVGRTDPRRLRQRADRRLHTLGRGAWCPGDRRAADRVRRCTDAGSNAAGHPIRLYRRTAATSSCCRISAAIRVPPSSILPNT